MTACKLHNYVTSEGLHVKCETHDWDFGREPKLQCPIGQIEEHTAKIIERVKAARNEVMNREKVP